METSQEILVGGGIIMMLLGFGTGNVMALQRLKKGNPAVARYLSLAHEGAYVQGAMLLGLSVAAGMSDLGDGLENLAAWLLVAGALTLFAKDIVNWLTSTTDEFAGRTPGLALGFLASPLHAGGLLILAAGVFF